MKICKIELIKRFETLEDNKGTACYNIFPIGYNRNKVSIIAYDEYPLVEGDNTGYCIGCVADDFVFTDKMVQINKAKADIFIDARADVETNADHKVKFATTRKKMIDDAGIV